MPFLLKFLPLPTSLILKIMRRTRKSSSLRETLYIMSSPETMTDICNAEQDIKDGKGIEVNLEEL